MIDRSPGPSTDPTVKTESLSEIEGRYGVLFDCSPIGICHLDPHGRIAESNPAFQRMIRATGPDLAGMSLADIAHPAEAEELRSLIRKVLTARRERVIKECHFVRKDGRLLWSNLTIAGTPDAGQRDSRTITVLVEDISTRKTQEAALKRQSMHDELTDLPSRGLLFDRISHAIRSGRRDGVNFAVLVLDLQHFRSINQTYGEHWGDVVLRQVGERLQRRLRGADTVARLGDDEFAGILVGNSEEEAIKSAARLMQALRKPCIAEDGKRISLAGSLGLAIFPDHGEDPDTLVRAAHRAMRMARSAGLDYAVFRSTDSE